MAAYTLLVQQDERWIRMATGEDLGRLSRLIRSTFEMNEVRVEGEKKVLYEGLGLAVPWDSTPCLCSKATASVVTITTPPPEPPPKSKEERAPEVPRGPVEGACAANPPMAAC